MVQVPDENTVIFGGVVYKASPEVMGCKLCAFDIDVTEACLEAPCFAESALTVVMSSSLRECRVYTNRTH